MCGIAGYYRTDGPAEDPRTLRAMLDSIAHRGPDDQGLFFINMRTGSALDCATGASDPRIREALPDASTAQDFSHHLAFAHCRYSVVDPSSAGHQPMWDRSRRACVSFNGEIYNYVELRGELEGAGCRFHTRTDTEVVLAGYLQWGTDVFARLNGQWALALYDVEQKILLLSRDRLGKVPLYYAAQGGRLYWASEIKAIRAACGADAFSLRPDAVHEYVVRGWRDRDGTFWAGINDFPPASFARVEADLKLDFRTYWSPARGRMRASDLSAAEAVRSLRALLSDALRLRVRADVPVAFELSGGVDSSVLVALEAERAERKLTAYTIQFDDPQVDEEPFARAVAARLGDDRVDYRVLRAGGEDFWRNADRFVWLEEEPFHSPNLQTNQSLRARMKAEGARVVISGAAGDEVFAGYADEYLGPYLVQLAAGLRWGRFLREMSSNTEYPPTLHNGLRLAASAINPDLAARFAGRNGEARMLEACYVPPGHLASGKSTPRGFDARMLANIGFAKMNYWLRSSNKANFGIPIEPRAPFLDYRIVDFAFSLPAEYLIRDGWHKWILRQTAKHLLPGQVLWRQRKAGFPFPLGAWLVASKAVVARNLSGLTCPYFDSATLLSRYGEFASKAPAALWRLVSLGLWWRRVIEGRGLDAPA